MRSQSTNSLTLKVMSRTEPTSTPARKDNQSCKRVLSSPFSPEDHLTKKNKAAMDEMDENEATSSHAEPSLMHLPPPDPEILKTVSIIKLYLKDEITTIVKAAVHEAVGTQLKAVREENARLTSENESLKVRVSELEAAVEESEQYSRRNSLRISNVAESELEDTDQVVIGIADTLNVNIVPADIDRSHRVGKPSATKTRDILVKFATYRARQRLYSARSSLKKTVHNGVFLNEDLTKSRSKLLWEARQKVKGNFLWGAWSADGRLFLKDVSEKTHKLTRSDDIVKYASKVPVKRPTRTTTPDPAPDMESDA